MSGLYLYCLTPPGSCVGLEIANAGEPVSCREIAGLGVWAAEAARAPRVTIEAIRAHNDVVQAVWSRTPACLPMRFGQWTGSASSLEERLDAQHTELERALARVAGAAEHGVRIADAGAAPATHPEGPRPATGRAYLEWLQARAHRQEEHDRRGNELAAALEASLEGLIRAQRADVLPQGEGLVTVSHLVTRAREAQYADAVRRFRDARPELDVLLTGPWPPYSFGA